MKHAHPPRQLEARDFPGCGLTSLILLAPLTLLVVFAWPRRPSSCERVYLAFEGVGQVVVNGRHLADAPFEVNLPEIESWLRPLKQRVWPGSSHPAMRSLRAPKCNFQIGFLPAPDWHGAFDCFYDRAHADSRVRGRFRLRLADASGRALEPGIAGRGYDNGKITIVVRLYPVVTSADETRKSPR